MKTSWKKCILLGFFLLIDHNNLQMMCYIFCYDNHVNAYNSKIQVRKAYFILQNNDIIIFNKHVNANHAIIAKL